MKLLNEVKKILNEDKSGLRITQVGYKHIPKDGDSDSEYGDGHERVFHVHSKSGEHVATVTHYTTDGGYPKQIIYHHMSKGKPTFNSYKAKRWVSIGDHVGRVHYEDDFDKDGENLPPEESVGVNNRNAHREVESAISGWSKSKKGAAFLQASHYDVRGKKTEKTVG